MPPREPRFRPDVSQETFDSFGDAVKEETGESTCLETKWAEKPEALWVYKNVDEYVGSFLLEVDVEVGGKVFNSLVEFGLSTSEVVPLFGYIEDDFSYYESPEERRELVEAETVRESSGDHIVAVECEDVFDTIVDLRAAHRAVFG